MSIAFNYSGNWQLFTGNCSCLALAFVTPAFFVAGFFLAAIPIIIHILNRRRYKTVPWAAMDFLLRAMKKNRRRLKFEQWLLLATRCLVMLLAATALARPLGCRESALAALAGQRSGLNVFVIDNSYSMAYEADRPDARTHLDQAKKIAKDLIAKLPGGGEAVAIVVASRPASAILSPPTYDLNAASSAVDRIGQSYGGTDLLGALRMAQDIGRREKTIGEQHLYLFTDGTRSAWETANADAVKQTAVELSKQFKITHFNLGQPNQWNETTLKVKPTSNLVSTRLGNDLVASVRSFGQGPAALAQWKLDDALLPGGGEIQFGNEVVNLTQTGANFHTGGPHVISAGLVTQDRLKVDDVRYRVVDVVSQLKVLIVEGERGMSKLGGSGAFLSLALAPPKDVEGQGKADSYVAPELISDLELGNKILADYRTVILAGVGQISPAQADQLALFVKQGGGLIIFMGEPVVADNYNQVLLPRGLMPGPLTKRVTAAANRDGFLFDFKPHGPLHPLLSLFAGEEKSGLDTTQVFTYWQIDLKPQSPVERVLNYLPTDANKNAPDPAITLHSLGLGHVITVTTTANAEWTSFPAKPAYVALMHELLAGSIGSGDVWMNLTCGESLSVPRSLKLSAAPILTDPTLTQVALETNSGEGAVAYRSGPLTRPGVYHLATGSATLPIAVNVPADEADIRTLDDAAIKRDLGDIDVDLQRDVLPTSMVAADETGNDFARPLMLAALLFVAAECFMAMKFGHYRR